MKLLILGFNPRYERFKVSLVAQRLKRLPLMRETRLRSLDWEDPLEKEMVTHSSMLAWETEESGELQSIGSQRVRKTEQLSMHTHLES